MCIFQKPIFHWVLSILNASDTLRKVLNLPQSTIMEYKSNNGENSQQYYTLAFRCLLEGLYRVDAGQIDDIPATEH